MIQEKDIISNVRVYNLDESVAGAKYSYLINAENATAKITKTTESLAKSPIGSGHDQFLTGIIVSFDLTFSNKAWVEAERYHFFDFITSQSTMHRIVDFDLTNCYMPQTDRRIIEIMKEKVAQYEDLLAEADNLGFDESENHQNLIKEKYLEILYSNPAGFRLTAKMITNYRQLKTIYQQRKTHMLPEWRLFCQWIETLPHSEFITGKDTQ